MHFTRKITNIRIEKEKVKLYLFIDYIKARISTEKL